MKPGYMALMFFIFILPSLDASAAGAILRVTCEPVMRSVDAKIYINGKLKGECPIDLKVPAGSVKLSARKENNTGGNWFYQEFHLGDGASKRVEVWAIPMPNKELKKAYKAEAGDADGMAMVAKYYSSYGAFARLDEARADESRKYTEHALRWGLKAVAAGSKDAALMFRLGDIYKALYGDTERADEYYKRGVALGKVAAGQGDTDAMSTLASAYILGQGVSEDKSEAARWLTKAREKGADVDWLFKLYKLE